MAEELVVEARLEGARQFSSDAKKMSKDVEGIGSSTERTSSRGRRSLASLGAGFTKAGKAATIGLTLPIVGLGVAAHKAFYEIDKGRDALQVATGAMGADMDALNESFDNVASTVPDSFEVVGTTMGEVQTRIGVTGKALEDVTRQLINMSRITKGDAATSARTLTRVMGDWALPASEASGLMDKLFVAGQATGIGFDDAADSLAKFGGPLRQMGFDLDTSLAMLGKFEKEGVNTKLVFGSLRIALGKMAQEGIKDPNKALTEMVKRIKEAGTAGEANKLALEMFGSRAGPDMAAAIREGRFEVEDLVKQLGGSSGAVNEFSEATMSGAERQAIAWNKAKLALEPFGEQLSLLVTYFATKLGPILTRAGKWLSGLSDNQKKVVMGVTMFLALGGPLLIFVGKVITGIKGISAALSFLAANPIVLVIAAVAALAIGLYILYQRSETFRAGVNRVWDIAKTTFFWIRDNWKMLTAILGGPIGAAVVLIVNHWDKIKRTASNLIGWFSSAWRGIKDFLVAPFNAALELINAVFSKIEAAANRVRTMLPGNHPGGAAAAQGGIDAATGRRTGQLGPGVPGQGGGSWHGNILTSGGTRLVGEKGPEVLSLPQGSEIAPLARPANVRPLPRRGSGGGYSGPSTLVLQVGGTKVAEILIKDLLRREARK